MDHGERPRCPSCGGDIKAYELRCQLCGHEFSNTRNSAAVQALTTALQDVVRTSNGEAALVRQADTIRNWPIPVNKTDLLEFATLAGGNAVAGVGTATLVTDAWRAKALETVAKGRIAFSPDDPGYAALMELNERLSSDQRTRMAVGASRKAVKVIIILIVVAAIVFGGLLAVVALM